MMYQMKRARDKLSTENHAHEKIQETAEWHPDNFLLIAALVKEILW